MVHPNGPSLFLSDLHLSPDRPATINLFLAFLAGRARDAADLYLLGDIFETWIGDDDARSPNLEVQAALKALTHSGVRCHLMHGNRDFLIGRQFVRETGCQLLSDPTLIHLQGERILLMHGDLLCSDDIAYQRFRRRIRNPIVKRLFLWRSLRWRRTLADRYRQQSGAATAEKPAAIMDVNPATVIDVLRRHHANRLIHGHTHRPGDHRLTIDGRVVWRHVLSEWHSDHGEVLVARSGNVGAVSGKPQDTWCRDAVRPNQVPAS
ncbi:UDP-2,3-diacylglucosamine diphosphatase [Thiocapsa imhoffii]|uniref:UDP-2,3-diacylglucosamine hydrolase n=1 Tax=Thiocapsa imhoffii TaxID=382777 RepID=A0A9X0WIN8_9GAMM|nr:UDP-2,3-diacylglucosamine diphosphatase [Thiocapsa imhoffii]